jgi:hypothetical protein
MSSIMTPGNLRSGGSRNQAPVQVVDVGREPALKSAFLSGRITNLAAPFIYHDPSKEIAFILMPMELNLRNEDQQKVIGQLTQIVMRGLPADAPKAYLLQPKSFFTMQSLMEAILEKDGVTPEMLQAEREKSDLLRDLIRTTDEGALREMARKNDAKVDATMFELLALNIDAAIQAGREDVVNQLSGIEKILMDETAYGKKMAVRVAALEALQKSPTRETLLAQLTDAPDIETREMLISMGRQLLDYQFFQSLSTRIDATTDANEKNKLITLRKEIQDTRVKIENAQREALNAKAQLVNHILTSQTPLETARANADQIDETFLAVLQANIQQAQQQGQSADLVKALSGVQQIAMQIVAERQPPEVQIINALLQAKYPDETEKVLHELANMVDERFVQYMGQTAEQLAQQDRTDASAKLTQIMIQARSILPKYDASKDQPSAASATPAVAAPEAKAPPKQEPPPSAPKPTIEIAKKW